MARRQGQLQRAGTHLEEKVLAPESSGGQAEQRGPGSLDHRFLDGDAGVQAVFGVWCPSRWICVACE